LLVFRADVGLQRLASRNLLQAAVELPDCFQFPRHVCRGCGPENFGKRHLHQNVSLLIDDFEPILRRILPRAMFDGDIQDGVAGVVSDAEDGLSAIE
jgi:hypothetical protein